MLLVAEKTNVPVWMGIGSCLLVYVTKTRTQSRYNYTYYCYYTHMYTIW